MLLQRTIACFMVFMLSSAITLAGQAAVINDSQSANQDTKKNNAEKISGSHCD